MVGVLQLCRGGEKLPSSAFHLPATNSLLWWALHRWTTGLEFGSPMLHTAAHLSAWWHLTTFKHICTQNCLGVQVGPLLSVSRNTWRSQKVHLHLKGLAKLFSYSWNVRGAESSQISWAIFMWSQEAQRCPGWLLCHPSSSSLEAGCVFWHSIGAALCFPEVPLCHPGGGNLSLLSCTLWLEVLNTQCMYNESLQQVASKTIFSKQYFKQ